MRSIFISYRREDAEGQAGRLFDDLSAHFGRDAVFMPAVRQGDLIVEAAAPNQIASGATSVLIG